MRVVYLVLVMMIGTILTSVPERKGVNELEKESEKDELDVSEDYLNLNQYLKVYPSVVSGSVEETVNFTLFSLTNHSKKVCWETNGEYVTSEGSRCLLEGNQTVHLQSSLIGVFYIRFYEEDDDGRKLYFEDNDLDLIIRRKSMEQNKAVTLFFTVILASALALMGLDIDLNVVLQTFKRPIGPLVGIICQFGFMPVSSYLVGWLFLNTSYERLGLLMLGSSPGGAASNFWTAMFDGDINLSVTMTFLSSVLSFGFTTLWIYILGAPLVQKSIPIPYIRLLISLVSFTLPLLIGVGFKRCFPKAGKVLKEKVSRPFFFLCLLALPAIGIWNNLHFFYLASWEHLVSGLLVGWLGYCFGALFAYLLKMPKPQIIAISLETAFQNGGIAFIVLQLTFPSPYSDMGIMPILGFFFCSTGPIMFVIYAIYLILKKIRGDKDFQQVNVEDTDDPVGNKLKE